MVSARPALLALCCLLPLAGGLSFRDRLAESVSRLWRPRPRQDPSRGPDRDATLRSVSTEPRRLDGGLEFTQRRRFLQPQQHFSVYNRAGSVERAALDWRRAAQRREDGREERLWERRWEDRHEQQHQDVRTSSAENSDRNARFLSLLTLVRFDHFTCNASTGENGTCYTERECSGMGGVASGACADDYGVCCVFTKSCGDRISINNTYFVNEGYPGSYDATGSCQVTIDKVHDNICQFRLDFDTFSIAQPEPLNNICMNDQFSVSGSTSMPLICGFSTGNHTEPACLQYHTGVQGVIKSYNFDFSNGAELANQDYTACVRMERNFCGIQYRPCQDIVNNASQAFSLGGGASEVGSVTGDSCDRDWLFVPCLTDNVNQPLTIMSDGNVCVDRVCGDRFNSIQAADSDDVSLYSFVKPFRLTYHTDSEEADSTTSETDNRGFCLDYVQQPCTT
ncbi:uncharacterized protein LOC119100086 [Pollicipes pollicipes]|uniref:uncharacterized protein LOC119100086 n=1 Tax=Pollicipes pollicipes TaxID=41117 RepID=UPI0018859BD3|nr:uncharacterized protein LOC119100086 [Pollicipes pollicipes]